MQRIGHPDATPICEPCREASAAYQRDYRAGIGRKVQHRADVAQLCRDKALRRLAKLHPAVFRALYSEEKRRVGLA